MGAFTAPIQTGREFHPVDKTYAHLTGQDIDKEVLGWYGIVPQEEAEERCLEPVQCPACELLLHLRPVVH